MADPNFRLVIEDVFTIRGRGTVITGTIESGSVCEGDVLILHHALGQSQVRLEGLEMFRRRLKRAEAGQTVGLLFRQMAKDEMQRGDVLTGA